MLGLNVLLMGITTFMAYKGIPVGDVLRYVGSICGFTLCYCIPILGHFIALKQRGEVGMMTYAVHLGLMAIGAGCVALQFV